MQLPPLSYAFHSDEKISHGFFRVLGELCTRAEGLAQARAPISELIHEGRVLIKRTRALLWFARLALDDVAYARAKTELRKASRLLSAQRDRMVTKTTLEQIAQKTSKTKDRAAVKEVLKSLNQKPVDEEKSIRPKLKKVVEIIDRLSTMIKRSTAKSAKWPSASKRLKKAFHATSKAEKTARKSGEDTAFHAWRKKAKRLFYELELTQAEPVKHQRRATENADELQDKLGLHQDCVVVGISLRATGAATPAKSRVTDILKARKSKLRKKSRKIARRLKDEI